MGNTTATTRKKHGIRLDNASFGIVCIFISTAIQSCFGFARDASPAFKFVIAAFAWLSLVYAASGIRALKHYPKYYKWVISLLLLNVAVSFVYSALFGKVYSGSKYIVLMTNMYAALNVANILFLFSVRNGRHFRLVLDLSLALFILNALLLVFNYRRTVTAYFMSYFMVYISLYLPYVSKKVKLYILLGTMMAMLAFFGGGRQIAITLVFMIGAWLGPKFASKKLVLIVSLSFLVLPVFFIWFFGNSAGSVFYDLQKTVSSHSESEEMSSNTRTFLFVECMEDFVQRDLRTQILGQGPLAHYDSPFFDNPHRFGIEVPILEWIMQCGLLYYILFTLACALAMWYFYRYGRNYMCQIASLLIGAFYFMCHVSNFNGISNMNLGFWMMMSMAVNPTFLKATDRQLKVLLGGYRRRRVPVTGSNKNQDE